MAIQWKYIVAKVYSRTIHIYQITNAQPPHDEQSRVCKRDQVLCVCSAVMNTQPGPSQVPADDRVKVLLWLNRRPNTHNELQLAAHGVALELVNV